MSLRLIFGRAGSGKTYYCLNQIKSKLNDGDNIPLVLVVPEQFTLQTEKNLIKMVATGGIMRAEVLSFRRMAYRVFNEVGGVTHRHINSAGKCMLIYRIIEGIKDDLKIFSKAVKQQGFVNTLSETIAEFKRYNITPEILKDTCNNINDDELLKDKLEEISTIYWEFEKTLHEKYVDADDDLTMLAEKLDIYGGFDGAEIWIDGFSGFTPQEYRVIEKLLKKAGRVNISLCTDCAADGSDIDSTDVFSTVRNAASKLLKIAGESGTAIEAAVTLKDQPNFRFRDSKEIAHLERQFFSFPYSTHPDKTEDVSIFSAANIYTEVENTARDIVRLCRDRGMRYRDIAVASRNLTEYEKLIGVIFTEYGIPYFIDRKRDINSHPLIQLILSVLGIFIHNWSYDAVFRYLKTGLTGIDRESVDVLENYVLACGIRGKRWMQDENWDFRVSQGLGDGKMNVYEQNMLATVDDTRRRIVKPLMDFRSKTKGRRKTREICTALYEFLYDIGIPERIEKRVDEFKASGELDLANEYGQIWNIVMEVLDQIVEVMGDYNTNTERFQKVLTIGFGEYKIGLIPPALDQVLVGSIERSKNHEISALYILGVNDGIFPAVSDNEGILSDKDRQNLRSRGVELAKDTRAKTFEEQYLIYTALTTAGRYLRLSYPIADHKGRSMRPSIIISRLKKVFPNICEYSSFINNDTDKDNMELIAAPAPTFNQLLSAVRRQAEGFKVNLLWWDVYRWYMGNEEWKEKCLTVLSGLSYSNQAGAISPDRAKKLYGSPVYSSISRFERFAACPFSYYVQYGLKAKERKVFKLTPPDVGIFMHSVIDRFSKELSERNMSWRELEREQCEEEVSRIVDDLLLKMSGSILNSSQRYKYLTGRLKRVLTRAVWLIAEHIKRSGFEPLGYEMAFGEGEKFPPISLELPGGEKIHLTGRIDRVDTMETEEGTYLRIIDYKSGNKDFKLSDVYYGLQIQLITYMDAIWENGSSEMAEPVLPGGILYFKVADPIIKGANGLTEEEIEKAIMKQLKMKGLLLADVKLIKEMDREIDGDSLIIPARINKGGVLGRSSGATIQQFELLRRHVRKLLFKTADEMLKGNVSIKPYKKKRVTSCTYCPYSSICQFEPGLKDNNYRILNDIKNDDIWKLFVQDSTREKGEGQ